VKVRLPSGPALATVAACCRGLVLATVVLSALAASAVASADGGPPAASRFAPPLVVVQAPNPLRHEPRVFGIIDWARPYNVQIYGGPRIYLHRGTIINPTGVTLQRGMNVAIFGRWNRDGTMSADRIDVSPRGGAHRSLQL